MKVVSNNKVCSCVTLMCLFISDMHYLTGGLKAKYIFHLDSAVVNMVMDEISAIVIIVFSLEKNKMIK